MALAEAEGNFDNSFLGNEDRHFDNGVLPSKLFRGTKLLEFILDLLSQPRYSAIISWEGTSGQFKIINPNQLVRLWGERNGRRSMTYQKFSRALRYYYHKNVLKKIRGQKYVFKFNLQELEKQYGSQGISFPATSDSTGNGDNEIPATGGCMYRPIAEQFNLQELKRQYGSQEISFPATSETTGNGSREIPATGGCMYQPIAEQFNLQEYGKQYGSQLGISFSATSETNGNGSYEIPASSDCMYRPIAEQNFPAMGVFGVSSSLAFTGPREHQGILSLPYPNSHWSSHNHNL